MYLKVRKEKGVVKTTPFFCDSHGICAQGGHNETYLFINQMSILVISSVLFLSMTRNLERVI